MHNSQLFEVFVFEGLVYNFLAATFLAAVKYYQRSQVRSSLRHLWRGKIAQSQAVNLKF